MDAVHIRSSFPNIALPLLTAALLLAAPLAALAQPSFVVSAGSVNLTATEGGQVTVSSSDPNTPITFTATESDPSGQGAWVSINGQFSTVVGTPVTGLNTGSGGTTVFFQPVHTPAITSTTIVFHATSPSGVTDGSVTVTYNASGGGGGGGGTNTIGASPATVNANNSAGVVTTQQVLLSTTSTTGLAYSTATAPASWLAVAPANGTVVSGTPVTLSLTLTSTGLTAGSYTATVTISYNGQTLPITVNFTVIGSTALVLSPSSVAWTYSSGGTAPSTSVAISAGTTTFSAYANVNWIYLSYPSAGSSFSPQSQLYNIPTTGGLTVLYNPLGGIPSAGTLGTVTVQDGSGNSSTFSVTFNGSGSGGTTGTVTVTPNPATLNSTVNQGCCSQATITVNSTLSGTLQVFLSSPFSNYVNTSYGGSINAGVANAVTLYGNATNLAAQTITGTLTASVTSNGTTVNTSITVNFVIGSGNGSGGGGTGNGTAVSPTSLSFAADSTNPTAIVPQNLMLTDSGNYTASATMATGAGWLSVGSTAGSSGGPTNPASIPVIVTPANLSVGSYSGTVSVSSASGTNSVAVNLTVYSSSILYVATADVNTGLPSQGSINVVENSGQLGVVPSLTAFTSGSAALNVTATTSTTWLSVSPSAGGTSTSNVGGNVFHVFLSALSLANGVYVGGVTFASTTATNQSVTVPVLLSVTGSTSSGSGLSFSQTSINLSSATNGNIVSQQVTVQGISATAFSAAVSINNGANQWLSVTPTSGTTPQIVTVYANPNGLAAGTYTGTVTVADNTGNNRASATVTFTVGSSGTSGGNVVSDHSSGVTFSYVVNGTSPPSQNVVISNQTSGTAAISFTVAAAVNGGTANWLSATVNGGSQGTTQATVVVGASPGALPAGSYSGTVTITPSGGSILSIPVTLSIQGPPTVSATPSQLTYAYQVGGSTPPAQTVQVTGSASGLSYSATPSTVSGGSWLVVNKSSGTTPDSLSVTVSPGSLTPGSTYQGSVLVQGTGAAAGSSTINVFLTVTAPPPTITSVQHAASFLSGPVSPGEIVSIFGTSMGPVSPLGTAVNSARTQVLTTLGGVQVLFNGYAAPLTYVSATQINCVVPYELAQLSSPYAEVKYLNQTSNAFTLRAAATAPGIFTAGNGTGQAAALNSDNSTNGPGGSAGQPAAAGTLVQVYMTGEGLITGSPVTGQITCANNSCTSISQIPIPLLPVAALVNNQPATISPPVGFFGEAPGFVSGVMQVNVLIPPNTPSGPASLVISVGGNSSQAGVTISVK